MKTWENVKTQIWTLPDCENPVFNKYDVISNDITAYLVSTLIQKRHALGYTQEKLAQLTGLKQSAIARMESSNIKPTIDTINKVSFALGLKLGFTEVDK